MRFKAAFLVSFLWELLHSGLYAELKGLTLFESLPVLVYASLIDTLLILCIIMVGRRLVNKPFFHRTVSGALFISVTGIAVAAIIEIHALSTGRWNYTSTMPLVFGIGLTPLIQLATCTFATLFLTEHPR